VKERFVEQNFNFLFRVTQGTRLSNKNYRQSTDITQFLDNNSAATVGFENRFTFSPGSYPLIRGPFGFDAPQWFVGFGNRYTFFHRDILGHLEHRKSWITFSNKSHYHEYLFPQIFR